MILFLLGAAALFAAYLYIKQQTVDSRQRSMANTAAISSMFLSSVSHQYHCRFSTLGGTWSLEKFTKSYGLAFENEGNPEAWQELKRRINDGTIEKEFYNLWIYIGASPTIDMEINEENKFIKVIISTEKSLSQSMFYHLWKMDKTGNNPASYSKIISVAPFIKFISRNVYFYFFLRNWSHAFNIFIFYIVLDPLVSFRHRERFGNIAHF